MLQRAHVVQAVRQFDEDDADVVHHGEHHLAEVFRLLLFPGGEIDLADLGDALDDVRDLFAELLADIDDGDRSVLDGIVQAGPPRWRPGPSSSRPSTSATSRG